MTRFGVMEWWNRGIRIHNVETHFSELWKKLVHDPTFLAAAFTELLTAQKEVFHKVLYFSREELSAAGWMIEVVCKSSLTVEFQCTSVCTALVYADV